MRGIKQFRWILIARRDSIRTSEGEALLLGGFMIWGDDAVTNYFGEVLMLSFCL